MQFVKFLQRDPEIDNPTADFAAEVIVAFEKIVKIEPRYYRQDDAGQRFVYRLRDPAEYRREKEAKKLGRYFVVHDTLGNEYDSTHASPAVQAMLEDLWHNAE